MIYSKNSFQNQIKNDLFYHGNYFTLQLEQIVYLKTL